MCGNKNPDVSVMSKCWKRTHSLSCKKTLLCFRGFKHPSGSNWTLVLENTLVVIFNYEHVCDGGLSPPGHHSPLSSLPLFPFPSSLHSAFLEYQLISLHSSPVWQLFAPLLFFGFHPFSALTHTFTHRFREMSGMRPFLQHHVVVVAHRAATAGPEERQCFCRAHGWPDG